MRRCHWTGGGAAAGAAEPNARAGGRAWPRLDPLAPLWPAPSASHAAPPPRAAAARAPACTGGGRAPGARACARREVEMGAEGAGAVTGPGSA